MQNNLTADSGGDLSAFKTIFAKQPRQTVKRVSGFKAYTYFTLSLSWKYPAYDLHNWNLRMFKV